jgi:hypothetical protein
MSVSEPLAKETALFDEAEPMPESLEGIGSQIQAPPEEDIELASRSEKEIQQEDELFLGDKIQIHGGKYNGTQGTIYYLDETLMRIMPQGATSILIDIPFVDGRFDPQIGIEEIIITDPEFHNDHKEEVLPFVTLIDLRVSEDQLVYSFSARGEEKLIYKVVEVDEENDTATLQDIGDESSPPETFEFAAKGIPLDAPFAILRPIEKPQKIEPVGENVPVEDDVIPMLALEEIELEPAVGIEEIPTYQRSYSDATQKKDMLQDLLKSLNPIQQKNPRKIRDIRQITESLLLLRNDLVLYDQAGNVLKMKNTSYRTLANLLQETKFPLAMPIQQVAKTLYLDHTEEDNDSVKQGRGHVDPETAENPNIDLTYLRDLLIKAKEFEDTQFQAPQGEEGQQPLPGELPRWFAAWQQYFDEYMRVVLPNASSELPVEKTIVDRDVLRQDIPVESLEDSDIPGLPVLEKIVPTPDLIAKVRFSKYRALASRLARSIKIENADEATIVKYLIFPLLYLRDLGATRSGKLALDWGISHQDPSTFESILEENGEISDFVTPNQIFGVLPGGTNIGNKTIHDWILAQPLYGGGLGGILPYLRSFGLVETQLSLEQEQALVKKITVFIGFLKIFLEKERATEKSIATDEASQKVVNEMFLDTQSATQLFQSLSQEAILGTVLQNFKATLPAYKENDIANFAALFTQYQDYMIATLSGLPEPITHYRNIATKGRFQKMLFAVMEKNRKKKAAGSAPIPNPCEHVAALELVRSVKDDEQRIRLMVKFLNTYRGRKENHWIWCSICHQHLLCEHEFLLIQEFLHPREKDALHKEILLNFSKGVFQGKYQCKNCGQGIRNQEYDTSLEYDDEGRPMMGRAVLVDKEAEQIEELRQLLDGNITQADIEQEIDFGDREKNLNYKVIYTIAGQMGISVSSNAYSFLVDRVQAALQDPAVIPSAQAYQEAYEIARKAKKTIMDYPKALALTRIRFCATYFLLHVMTHIPDYETRSVVAGCPDPVFSGYPIFTDEGRKEGIKYLACGLSMISDVDEPWKFAGIASMATAKRREFYEKMLDAGIKYALTRDDIQQEIEAKRAFNIERKGIAAAEGRFAEDIPDGFLPLQMKVSKEEAANEPTVAAAASKEQRAYSWILQAHRLALETSFFVPGSMYSETSCCFRPLTEPLDFWRKATSLPTLESKQPPRGSYQSSLNLEFSPQSPEILLASAPPDIWYRIFFKVCFRGERVGLPHEPGYDLKCHWCGLKFPVDPRLPPPQLMKGKEREYETELGALIAAEKRALEEQQVEVTRETFEELLDAVHLRNRVPPHKIPPVESQSPLLRAFADLNPMPTTTWAETMGTTLENLATLEPNASRDQISEAIAILSDEASLFSRQILMRYPRDPLKSLVSNVLAKLFRLRPESLAETLRTYVLVPLNRLLANQKIDNLIYVQKGYKLADISVKDMKEILFDHVNFKKIFRTTPDFLSFSDLQERVNQLSEDDGIRTKLQITTTRLSALISFFTDSLRAPLIPGGLQTLRYFIQNSVAGCLSEFIDPTLYPSSSPDSANLPAQILQSCFSKLHEEGLDMTDEDIRIRLAKRAEKEKQDFINELDRLSNREDRRRELMRKKLGIGKWAIGGTEAIYGYKEDQLERERVERERAGLVDFGQEMRLRTGEGVLDEYSREADGAYTNYADDGEDHGD